MGPNNNNITLNSSSSFTRMQPHPILWGAVAQARLVFKGAENLQHIVWTVTEFDTIM